MPADYLPGPTDLKVDSTNMLARIQPTADESACALQNDHEQRGRSQAAEASETAANGASF
jgi:hypothetical protein